MNQTQYSKINTIVGWVVFAAATLVYLLTMEPTASFWDCSEFITTAFKLEVGHPPGAPLFMITGRLFTLLAGGNLSLVPVMVNAMSALASSFTILFLFWTITHIAKRFFASSAELSTGKLIAIMGAGAVGALAFTFSDSFWFSAIESEVYASSSLFTAMVFWAVLKWENVADEKYSNRWLVLIAYLMGLSIGVHLLNLLAIPAIVLVYYYKKSNNPTNWGAFKAFMISIVILGVVMYGIIQGLFVIASWLDLLFVNSFGLPVNSGVIFYAILLLVALTWGIAYTHKRNKVLWNTALLFVTVLIIGYSSVAMVIIRSAAQPPMDENSPNNVFSLLSYLNRDQYGDRPLGYGQYFNAPVVDYKKTSPNYAVVDGKYVVTDYKTERVYDPAFTGFFPRMYSDQDGHDRGYYQWTSMPQKSTEKPTFFNNMEYFFGYQINFMYFRYFMWNFAGRQNDIQGDGNPMQGNWISGIPFFDNMRLGDQSLLPDYIKNNKGHNAYYFLPLILGLLGMYFSYKKDRPYFWVVMLFFFFTGLAIVVYLNQPPFQPRERDYAYAGSFYVFAIWIGLGVIYLYELMKKFTPSTVSAVAVTGISLVLVPGLMGQQNWDDHDRSGRYTCRDFAANYLNSCEKNAIIFTNGDNDTFPLWYAQEVENIRPDVRVINMSYLATDWYIDQMKRRAYESAPVPFSLSRDKYLQGKRDLVYIQEQVKEPTELKTLIDFVSQDDPKYKLAQGTELFDFIPSKMFRVTIDSAAVLKNNVVSGSSKKQIAKTVDWTVSQNYLRKNDLMVLDLLAHNDWTRPIYFAFTTGPDAYVGLQDYFQLDGFTYRFVPVKTSKTDGQVGSINTDILYNNVMNKFVWGGIDNPKVYLDENNQRMLMNIKNMFARLAETLIAENKKDSARKVLDKCMKLMPNSIVPYNYYNLLISDSYYRLGDVAKGDEIVAVMQKNTTQELKYFFSLSADRQASLGNDRQRSMAVLYELLKMTEKYNRTQLHKSLNDVFQAYYPNFQQSSGK